MNKQLLITDLNKYNQQIIVLNKKETLISITRFISFFLTIVTSIVIISEKEWWAVIIALLSIGCFFIMLLKHNKLSEELMLIKERCHVLTDILSRYQQDWKQLKETGIEFGDDIDLFAYDLDIIGPASLYQYLCCARTKHGKKQLADYLLRQDAQTKKDIELRQLLVKELMSDSEFLIKFITSSYLYQSNNPLDEEKVVKTLENFSNIEIGITKLESSFVKIMSILTPLITVLSIFNIINSIFAFIAIVLSSIMYVKVFKHSQKMFELVHPLEKSITSYQRMIEIIIKKDYQHIDLNLIKDVLKGSSKALKKLNKIIAMFNLRHNVFLYMPANLIFFWDYFCLIQLDQWQDEYGSQLIEWADSIGKMEAYVSLSLPVLTKNKITFPKINESEVIELDIQDCIHPLMDEEKAVGNDFTLKSITNVITGSNMAGKTTFLRSLGVNLVLMQAGTVICGQYMKANKMKIVTSMRVRDDISMGVSTFYGELQRIKKMVEISDECVPAIMLIDEIFKGTNLKDRIIGAKKTIEKLNQPHLITFVTTHDEQLTTHEEVNIINYHFEEYYKDNQIFFDYKIKEGASKSTNAQFLMKMIGILDE